MGNVSDKEKGQVTVQVDGNYFNIIASETGQPIKSLGNTLKSFTIALYELLMNGKQEKPILFFIKSYGRAQNLLLGSDGEKIKPALDVILNISIQHLLGIVGSANGIKDLFNFMSESEENLISSSQFIHALFNKSKKNEREYNNINIINTIFGELIRYTSNSIVGKQIPKDPKNEIDMFNVIFQNKHLLEIASNWTSFFYPPLIATSNVNGNKQIISLTPKDCMSLPSRSISVLTSLLSITIAPPENREYYLKAFGDNLNHDLIKQLQQIILKSEIKSWVIISQYLFRVLARRRLAAAQFFGFVFSCNGTAESQLKNMEKTFQSVGLERHMKGRQELYHFIDHDEDQSRDFDSNELNQKAKEEYDAIIKQYQDISAPSTESNPAFTFQPTNKQTQQSIIYSIQADRKGIFIYDVPQMSFSQKANLSKYMIYMCLTEMMELKRREEKVDKERKQNQLKNELKQEMNKELKNQNEKKELKNEKEKDNSDDEKKKDEDENIENKYKYPPQYPDELTHLGSYEDEDVNQLKEKQQIKEEIGGIKKNQYARFYDVYDFTYPLFGRYSNNPKQVIEDIKEKQGIKQKNEEQKDEKEKVKDLEKEYELKQQQQYVIDEKGFDKIKGVFVPPLNGEYTFSTEILYLTLQTIHSCFIPCLRRLFKEDNRDVIILYDTLSFFFLRILGIEDGDKELTQEEDEGLIKQEQLRKKEEQEDNKGMNKQRKLSQPSKVQIRSQTPPPLFRRSPNPDQLSLLPTSPIQQQPSTQVPLPPSQQQSQSQTKQLINSKSKSPNSASPQLLYPSPLSMIAIQPDWLIDDIGNICKFMGRAGGTIEYLKIIVTGTSFDSKSKDDDNNDVNFNVDKLNNDEFKFEQFLQKNKQLVTIIPATLLIVIENIQYMCKPDTTNSTHIQHRFLIGKALLSLQWNYELKENLKYFLMKTHRGKALVQTIIARFALDVDFCLKIVFDALTRLKARLVGSVRGHVSIVMQSLRIILFLLKNHDLQILLFDKLSPVMHIFNRIVEQLVDEQQLQKSATKYIEESNWSPISILKLVSEIVILLANNQSFQMSKEKQRNWTASWPTTLGASKKTNMRKWDK
ncbi:MAG: hypothetical protein EZS28_002115 [Streblomastix strix]|uniref:Uncharacterized protein n=1 Tax=Streblomastix strix TaxID=222440 RepID=A0A5J4X555_9EUKA|nr:MAG: hypothetical protein EZS28_002115 [Streblomastix strix]